MLAMEPKAPRTVNNVEVICILPPSERFPARAAYTPPFRSRGMTGNRLLPHTVYKGGKNSTWTVGFHLKSIIQDSVDLSNKLGAKGAVRKRSVIANQRARWCGTPRVFPSGTIPRIFKHLGRKTKLFPSNRGAATPVTSVTGSQRHTFLTAPIFFSSDSAFWWSGSTSGNTRPGWSPGAWRTSFPRSGRWSGPGRKPEPSG